MKLKQHLELRGMDPTLYRVSKCYSTSKITFFLYNLSGQIVGYHHYRPKSTNKKVNNNPKLGRYFTKVPKNTIGVFGLEVLDPSKRELFVVEGIFKASMLHRLGYNAIAVLTSSPKQMAALFRILRAHYRLVAIGDNDKAGQGLVKIVQDGFCSPRDLDEMSDEEIEEMLTIRGLGRVPCLMDQ